MVNDLNKVTRHEDYDLNFEIQMAEIRQYEKELWENNQFCSCESEKQRRFRRRRKRKVNEEFDEELSRLMKGQLPKDGSQSRDEGK